MDEPKDGGPAFPVEWSNNIDTGMTLRDYFAAKAMRQLKENMKDARLEEMARMAKEAYAIADAMLTARGA